MKKKRIFFTGAFGLLAALLVFFVAFQSFSTEAPITAKDGPAPSDESQIQNLLEEFTKKDLASLPAQEIKSFQLPTAGVHVMRVRIEETYSIEGIGTETVELSGWIAVKHDNPRAIDENMEVSWNNAKVPTEFVGMDLQGDSEIFGPVRVRLNSGQPSIGQVGGITLPGGLFLDDLSMEDNYSMPPLPMLRAEEN